MASKIYTRSGDSGMTSLVGGSRVSKTDWRIECYGTVDELNSFIGLARSFLNNDLQFKSALNELDQHLESIQNKLFNLGSLLACENEKLKSQLPVIQEKDVVFLELAIDKMQVELTPLNEFILPGGAPLSSVLHVARTVCRRSERLIIHLYDNKQIDDLLLLKFINRLSDFLFVCARFANLKLNHPDVTWKKDSPA